MIDSTYDFSNLDSIYLPLAEVSRKGFRIGEDSASLRAARVKEQRNCRQLGMG